MRFSTELLNHLTVNPHKYLTLRKIYTFHTKHSSHLFTHPLIFYLLGANFLHLFAKKVTRTLPKASEKRTYKTTAHNFFLNWNPHIFTQNQSNTQPLALSKSKSFQYRSLRQGTSRQGKRTRTLLKYLLISNKRTNPYTLTLSHNTDLGTLRRYKLFQTPAHSPISRSNFSTPTDSYNIFSFFTLLLKLHKRGARKQNILSLYKRARTIKPLNINFKKNFSFIGNNSLLIHSTPVKLKTSPSRSPQKTTLRSKVSKRTALHYHWTLGHLNTPRSLQPVTYPLILSDFAAKLGTNPKETSLLNPVSSNQQSYVTNLLKNLLTPFRLGLSEVNHSSQINAKTRFSVGTEINSVTMLTFPLSVESTQLNVQERVNAQVQQFAFITTLTTKKFLSILVSQTKVLNPKNAWENLFSRPLNKKISFNNTPNKPSNLASWSRYQNDDLYINTRLTHIRFKPGYARQWRTFRNEFKEVFTLPNRYQYRLTRYLVSLSAAQRLHQRTNQTLLLKHSLVESKLAPTLETSVQYITKGLTFLNGSLSSNPNLHLTQHDFIQLVVSLKYYTIVKWQITQALRNKSILAKLLWKRGKNWRRNKFTFPNWVLNFSTTFLDTPLYLEVDHFSLSTYVLTANYAKPEGQQAYPKVLPLYNWKYIV